MDATLQVHTEAPLEVHTDNFLYADAALNTTATDDMTAKPEHVIDIPLMFVLVVATLMGSVGNSLVIGAIFVNKNLKTMGNVFIVNLAIADLCVSSFVDPFTIVGAIYGEQYYLDRAVLCDVVGAICLTACISSLLNIAAISVNRYIHICHPNLYNRVYTLRNTLVICVLIWIASFIIESPNLVVGFGDHWYDPKEQSCLWDRTKSYPYGVTLWSAVVLCPLILTGVCYAKIFIFVIASKKRVASSSDAKATKGLKESAKLARTLFIIFVVFGCCWTPYAVVIIGDRYDTWSVTIHVATIILAHTNSSLNFVLYGLTNKQFRLGYIKFLKLDKCIKMTAEGDTSGTRSTMVTDTKINP